ncbi:MAG: hypothetical protein CVV27_08945 [Candidatus Melainabacteria bacterium HGW-Melainabacteria-1]|nr:MAG: hypothetical protein CVV27_08945 [Candidatus Melainabacteria bacterium HGW-Melainabacteria-1]
MPETQSKSESLIRTVPLQDLPPDVFNDAGHHVILRSLLQHPRPQTVSYAGPDGSYAIYDPEMGFCYHNPTGQHLGLWARWIAERQLPMLAGELNSHYALLQTMGDVITEDEPIQIFCRYETQDFCVQDSELPPVPASTLRLKQAEPGDVDRLFHFYQRSETMQARSRESLLYTIQHNRLIYLQKLGKIVSAALTHCESADSALIGGVYTPAMHRGKGYGFLCVHALLAALKAESKTPMLFYEKQNAAARSSIRSWASELMGTGF